MNEELKTKPEVKNKVDFKKVLVVVLIVAFLIFVILFGPGIWNKYFGKKDLENMPYTAVFLDNGQVYFGKLESSNKKEFVLVNVYYLQLASQAEAQSELNQTRFNLIKLGTELHGPQDILRMNRSHIMFWEELRSDSSIVQSITKSKSQNSN